MRYNVNVSCTSHDNRIDTEVNTYFIIVTLYKHVTSVTAPQEITYGTPGTTFGTAQGTTRTVQHIMGGYAQNGDHKAI